MKIVNIDVTLLDKSKFKSVIRKKTGNKAIFCDLVLFDSKTEEWDGYIKQSLTKEERAAKVQSPIVGNWREVVQRDQPDRNEPQRHHGEGDGIPF